MPFYKWNRETLIQYGVENGLIIDDEAEIKPGDLYLAGRNTEPHILTCKNVDPRGWIIPQEKYQYSFDLHECVKITGMK